MPKLKIQRFKLERVIIRLRERDVILFKTCTKAIRNKNKERATIFANELVEVRKLVKVVAQTQILVERLILRLETLKELSTAFADLKPVLAILHGVTRRLTSLMPQMAYEMDRVNDSISETLAMTSMGSRQIDIPIDVKTQGGEEILREVSELLEQEVSEKLPEPPASATVIEEHKPVERVRQMVALTATCSEVCEETEPHEYAPYKDVELQQVSLRMKKYANLEDTVLDYVKKLEGNLDVTQCALKLKVPPKEVEKALENLGAQGKIRIKR